MTLSLEQAWRTLERDPGHAGAWSVVAAELEALSRSSTVVRAYADDALGEVTLALFTRARGGDLPRVRELRGYLLRWLRNRSIDLRRTADREGDLPTGESGWKEAESGARRDLERALAALDRAYRHALERRRPRDRPGLERAWRQVLALSFEPVDMDDLLEADLDPEAAESDRCKHRNRLYTAHRRARRAVSQALDHLEDRGELSPHRAADARELLKRLVRVRPAPSRASSS